MSMPSAVPFPADLQPPAVWQLFGQLLSIPRISKKEQQVKSWISTWAEAHGIQTNTDTAGNLYLHKPAKPGMEDRQPVILQAHLDMVYQATRADFNPEADPIEVEYDAPWLRGISTTLGADNGIGLVMIMAVLADPSLAHGPLTALLTVDEEAGMSGALNLDATQLQGDWLINLDTEEWGEIYVGCAGSQDAVLTKSWPTWPADPSSKIIEISLKGLKGGHSGIDTHRQRGNASRLLAGLLVDEPVQIVRFEGGNARNAIPRNASAVLGVPASLDMNSWLNTLNHKLENRITKLESGSVPHVEIQPSPPDTYEVLTRSDSQQFLASLLAMPDGVLAQHGELEVYSSANLGIVRLEKGHSELTVMFRSFDNDALAAMVEQKMAPFEAAWQIRLTDALSAWTPDLNSPLLKYAESFYRQTFLQEPVRQVIHAGLECGLIQQHRPSLQMVSFGPTIRGAHAPGEQVDTTTVLPAWHYLRTLLENVPAA